MAVVKVNREDFLQRLQYMQPGTNERDSVDQATCILFDKGWMIAFNGELSCRCKSKLGKEVRGAVKAKPLIELLAKMDNEELTIEFGKQELIVKGKKEDAGVSLEADVSEDWQSVETPDEWQALPDDFEEAVQLVSQCIGRDDSHHNLTCVHITSKYIEACDNAHATRYRVETPVKESMLVKGEAVKSIVSFNMTEFAETDHWMHFRNSTGLTLSCLRYLEEYIPMKEVLRVEDGVPATLPKSLPEAVTKAEIFSKENKDTNYVRVELRPGRMRLIGRGSSGWYRRRFSMSSYKGKELGFLITPTLLVEIVNRHSECMVGANKIRVDGGGGKWVYVACLSEIPDAKEPEGEEISDDDGDSE